MNLNTLSSFLKKDYKTCESLLSRMTFKQVLLNIPRVFIKKRWQVLKITFFAIVSLALFHRYYEKYKILIERRDADLKPCVNVTFEELKDEPTISHFTHWQDLDWQLRSNVRDFAMISGVPRRERAFLTIGIPSIKRVTNSTYVLKTLHDLELKTSDEDKRRIVCVVFLCDSDPSYNARVERHVSSAFPDSLASGFFQIVRVKLNFYPKLEDLKQNFHDAPNRVRWRAKQVSDYVFLFRYCSSLGQYHLQLEDDVVSVTDYVGSISQYIRAVDINENLRDLKKIFDEIYRKWPNNASLSMANDILVNLNTNGYLEGPLKDIEVEAKWMNLEFSVLGFIGKLFRSRDLEQLAIFLAFYYDEQPVDWLIIYFLKNLRQTHKYIHTPSLFQHFGLRSSFDHLQENKLKDRFFDAARHDSIVLQSNRLGLPNFLNPLAVVLSNISDSVANFYVPSYSFQFQAKCSDNNQTIILLFPEKQNIANVTIETGSENKRCLRRASLSVGRKHKVYSPKDNYVVCLDVVATVHFEGCLSSAVLNRTEITCVVLSTNEVQLDDVVFVNLLIFPLQL